MVKFSDLEKGKPNPQKSQEKDSGIRSRASGLSFRDLEKETRQLTSREVVQPKEASEEERKAIYDAATAYLTGVLDDVRKRRRFALEPGEEIVRRMIESRSTVDPLLIRAIYQENPYGYLINHCVNVAVFALKMATVLGLGKLEQEQIGLAALLHEVGMGVIPEKLIYKEQKLDEQEYAIFKKRPEFAYKILKGFGDQYSFLADTALQVHECMDGSGYPMGLSGDEIHLYAQIIGLVDMYEALIHSRPQREKFLHFSAVKQIIKTGKRRYQKKHLKALLNIFSIFPLHSFVKLNSNAVGRVIQTYPDQPMRPKVEVIFDSQGRRVLARHVVDLSENSILYIVDSVSERDIAGLAEGPGVKPFPQAPPATHADLESAVTGEVQIADSDVLLDDDILEITEDDFEPQPPQSEKDSSGADRGTFTMRSKEVEERVEEFTDEDLVALPAMGKGRWVYRYKWLLLVAGIVILGGVVLWKLGLWDVPAHISDEPGKIVELPGKKASTGPQQKAKGESAGSAVQPKMEGKPAAIVSAIKEKTAAKPDDEKKLKAKTQSPPPPAEGPALVEMQSASAAKPPKGETKTPIPKTLPGAVKPSTDVAAAIKPAGNAAAVLKARGGSYPYSIKLDSFRTLKETEAVLFSYRDKGLKAYWVKANLGSQGVWYRIFAGTYQTEEQAAADISRFGLKNAVVKATRYAALIGAFSTQTAVDQKIKSLSDKGYFPYVIQAGDQSFFLFVGAFYTRKGGEEQVADLLSNGIQGQVTER
ncbi:MAG: HD domain-containing phosphohydrolase [Thermodesulfobacteriota bacterium]